MKKITLAGAALLASTAAASAGGLDRSGQPIGAVFAEDGTTTLSFGVVTPSVTGTDSTGASYDVGDSYTQLGLSYTNRISDSLSYALIIDQPYGANITYGTDPLTTNLGGTMADLTSQAATFILRYSVSPRFSVYGGISYEGVGADVALNGISYRNAISTSAVTSAFNAGLPGGTPALSAATLGAAIQGSAAAATAIDTTYGAGTTATLGGQVGAQAGIFAANGGYNFSMDTDYSFGYLVGAAYEIPDIALRLAVTYRFETEHSSSTMETMFTSSLASTVDFVTPQSLNIDFQTGIAENTLLTAGFRWTDFSAVDVVPTLLGSDLVNLDDSFRYSLGVARRFNENFAGSLTLTYEPEGDGSPVSPLGPTDGQFGITLGGRYTSGNMSISGGINYTWLGDANAGVGGQPVASFSGSSALGIGLRTEFTF
jgi:long-subunit fatty acid transport protein